MNLIGKKYRTLNSISYFYENDVQGGGHMAEKYMYIYIFDDKIASTYYSDKKQTDKYIQSRNVSAFNNIEPKMTEEQIANRLRRISSNNDPTLKSYKVLGNSKIEMSKFNPNTKDIELSFLGEILLSGNAIRGVFYNKGKKVTPMRVYYNVDEPLPNPLIQEHNNNDLALDEE